ncbi:Beta-1,3-glucosyltransferase [Mycetocola reblochoni REB411]|uniref:Beta-1,3-glucosyltransferase n=1 Tax=Mycetocola reblochoni REB411 TaxID=1255698 RepID=A0A1R4K1H6_9MICO|nr:Beta-1,3-glucosyltransferase [Mycetocola reblochoni REB411]
MHTPVPAAVPRPHRGVSWPTATSSPCRERWRPPTPDTSNRRRVKLPAVVHDALAHPRLLPARESVRAARNWAIGVGRRMGVRPDRFRAGLLSVVVPAYGVEAYIAETLGSLSKQRYSNIEIIVVDDGSPDASAHIARKMARSDPRIRVISQKNQGLSGARNTGISAANGEYLAFLDGDDFVDRHAYSDAIGALVESGSDFAVMPYRREKNGTFPSAAPWIRSAHQVTRLGVTIDEFPDILVNAVAWSKVYRRDFWDASGFQFPQGVLYEDQAVSTAAYTAARSFDVLSRVSINWRIRADQTSITQQITQPRNIRDHGAAVQESLQILREAGREEVHDERLRQVLNNNMGEFLLQLRGIGGEAWTEFQHMVKGLVDLTGERGLWSQIDARKKVLLSLVVAGERDAALGFLRDGGWHADHFPARAANAELHADGAPYAAVEQLVPPFAMELSATETQATVEVRSVERVDDDLYRLRAIAYINRIAGNDYTFAAALVDHRGGTGTPLEVRRGESLGDVVGHTRRYADMSDASIEIDLPLEALAGTGTLALHVELGWHGVARSTTARLWGNASVPRPGFNEQGLITEFVRSVGGELEIRQSRRDFVVRAAKIDGEDVTVSLVAAAQPERLILVDRGDRFGLERVNVPLRAVGDGTWTARFRLPRRPGADRCTHNYNVTVRDAAGKDHRAAIEPGVEQNGKAVEVVSRYTTRATGELSDTETSADVLVRHHRGRVFADEVRLTPDALVVDASFVPGTRLIAASIISGSLTFPVPIERVSDTAVRLVIPRNVPGADGVVRPLKSGDYTVMFRTATGKVELSPATAIIQSLSVRFDDGEHSYVLFGASRGSAGPRAVRLGVEPYRRTDERGGGNQWRLKDEYRHERRPLRRAILFRNLYSEAANDSALAVHNELLRRGSDIERVWAVRDRSVPVPDGAVTVVEGTREYFEAFALSQYVMVNVHQPDWFFKRDEQTLIQTFHGYPFKFNGREWWDRLDFGAERKESFFRRADEWDILVSPAPYASEHLQTFYRPERTEFPEMIELGYPRNDVLVRGDAERRDRARRVLGIGPNQRAILYAPTFRDYVSGDDMSADMVALLDYAQLAKRLGPGYVVLLRGHPFNARRGTKVPATVINVTDYPDINDLILASDIGVLDYSSLRFDYALTDKPMVFFDPDRDRYFSYRQGFIPYDGTAPGPHVDTLSSLTSVVKDPPASALHGSDERKEFRERFTPLEDGRAASRLVDAMLEIGASKAADQR